jgi:uncharacterized protein YbaR (Trm112 family)
MIVCPGCRTRTAERLDLRTLERRGDELVCECGRRYPIVDDVPIVVTHEIKTIEPVVPELAELVREHVSIYMDSHWNSDNAIAAKLASLDRVPLAVELGCSAGRIVAELARLADHVVGVELHFATLRRARRMLAGETVAYERRMYGTVYEPASATGIATTNITLVCGDALDPPLVPGVYQRVVALNLLDSVSSPRQLLSVIDGLCAIGGEIILSSPYSWQTDITDEPLGGACPDVALVEILETGANLGARYAIEDNCDLPWTLRRDARSSANYRIHYVRARKLPRVRTV